MRIITKRQPLKVSAFITITDPKKRGDTYEQCFKSASGFADEVVVIDGKDTWPKEFSWEIIGQHFQRGYEQSQGDWVVHLDTDFIFHEKDYDRIREVLTGDAPAMSFYKHQYILPDRYNLKSRLVIAVNKGKYGDRIKFNSGGDLCQPSLDGKELRPEDVPQADIAFNNYEKIAKTESQVKDDVGRMARAWQRHFGEAKLGSDDESAYAEWLKMVVGRFSKPQKEVPLESHPKVMQELIAGLKPGQFGYDGLGNLPRNNYA